MDGTRELMGTPCWVTATWALAVVLWLTPVLIPVFTRLGLGQEIRDDTLSRFSRRDIAPSQQN
jgi:UDP-N-acetylmuramyl pentapeptide phosphotransferase/UDP-N-acetylglucosamine-1-phosphate transferase